MTESEKLFIAWARIRWLNGKSTKQIADELNVHESYVYNRLDKIKKIELRKAS